MNITEQLPEIEARLTEWLAAGRRRVWPNDITALLAIIKADREVLREIMQLFEWVEKHDYETLTDIERGRYLGYEDAAVMARKRLQE